jgi:hypothetical protein
LEEKGNANIEIQEHKKKVRGTLWTVMCIGMLFNFNECVLCNGVFCHIYCIYVTTVLSFSIILLPCSVLLVLWCYHS